MCLLFRTANTSNLKSMSAHCSLHPKARKAEQFWAIKELCGSDSIPRPWLESCLFEKLWFCNGASTVQGLKGVASCGRPLPASQRTKGYQPPTRWCHSHRHHNLGIKFATLQWCFKNSNPALKPTNIHFWKYCYTNNTFRNFFLFWVFTGEKTISKWPAGSTTRKEQFEKGLDLHKPQVLVRTWRRTYPLCPAQVLFGLQSTIGF